MKKKRGILYWLKVIVAILMIFILMYRCSKNYAIPVSADSVTLNPNQTLALYGLDITGSVRRNDNTYQDITFHYAFPLHTVGNQSLGGGFAGSTVDTVYQLADQIKSTDGIVYVAQESDWGGGLFPTWNSSTNTSEPANCNFDLKLSVDIGSYTDLDQMFAWSSGNWSYVNERYQASNFPIQQGCPWECYYQAPFSGSTLISSGISPKVASGSRFQVANGLLTRYAWDGLSAVDETQQSTFCFQRIYATTQTIGLPVNYMKVGMQTMQQVRSYSGYSGQAPTGDIWLIIFCPTIKDHVPPVTTPVVTTRPPSTYPVATFPVATMPTDVTNVPAIVINDNSITQVNQLNLIIGQLNLIYAKLCAEGQLGIDVNLGWNPDLQDGENLPYYDTVIQSQMHDIINGHTTATVPNFDTSFVKDGYDFLTANAWIAKMGALSLALSVAAWIIFRGRGG